MQVSSPQVLDDGTIEHELTLDGIPGVLWTPADPPPSESLPLVLLGHPGDLRRMLPRVRLRAQQCSALGFASATLELPGSGGRDPLAGVDDARDDLRRALARGERPSEQVVDRLILPLVEQSVPEWRALLDAVGRLPGLGGPAAVSGGIIAIGVRLARVEPRLVAAGLFAGSYIPRATIEEARGVSIPLHVLLQWDDHGNDRQAALDLFDAFGSREKTLQANLGGHTGVPPYAAQDAGRFFARHLT